MLIAAFYINAGNASYLLYRSFLLVAHFCGLLHGSSFHRLCFYPLRIAKSWSKHTSLKYTAGIYNFYNYQVTNGFLRIRRMFVFVASDMQGMNAPWFLVNQRIITNCRNTTTLNLQVRMTSELFCNKNLFSQICLFHSNIWIKLCSISVSYLRAQSKTKHHGCTDSQMIKPYYWIEPKTKIQFSYSKCWQL